MSDIDIMIASLLTCGKPCCTAKDLSPVGKVVTAGRHLITCMMPWFSCESLCLLPFFEASKVLGAAQSPLLAVAAARPPSHSRPQTLGSTLVLFWFTFPEGP